MAGRLGRGGGGDGDTFGQMGGVDGGDAAGGVSWDAGGPRAAPSEAIAALSSNALTTSEMLISHTGPLIEFVQARVLVRIPAFFIFLTLLYCSTPPYGFTEFGLDLFTKFGTLPRGSCGTVAGVVVVKEGMRGSEENDTHVGVGGE